MQKKYSARISRLIESIDGSWVYGGEKPSTPLDLDIMDSFPCVLHNLGWWVRLC